MKISPLLLALSLAAAAPGALAERADRDKPMRLEANRLSVDDAKKIQILEGNVVITKGTLVLRADKVVVTEDPYGFQKGVATAAKGKLATFRQKREGKDDYIEGEAERIEYDSNSEVAELFRRAWVKSGGDEIRGDYIWYDAVNEKYLATAGDKNGAPGRRVIVTIEPRNKKDGAERPPPRSEPLELKGAADLGESTADAPETAAEKP
ncbi:MAG: lipopolysaccharide transport periplasmic protein LptA [Azonexus sp.]|jgi:lipopolysaccharide export system protein LptA|nr:lipopolysaccharide transport periplasmic protein LptA [Azonexus sp.]